MLLKSTEIYDNCFKPMNYIISMVVKRIEAMEKYSPAQLDQLRADLIRRFDYNQRRRNLNQPPRDLIDFHVKETIEFYKVSRTDKNEQKELSKNN